MRKALKVALGACLLITLAGCMTAYQPHGLTGGYKEQKLDEDTYLVSFYGNGHTPRGVVLKYFLYRCAELTLDRGYAYFELYAPERSRTSWDAGPFVKVAGHAAPPVVTYTPGVQVTTWSASGIVRMYRQDILAPSPTLFSAREVVGALGSDVHSGNPTPTVPAKFRSVEGKFPVLPVNGTQRAAPPTDATQPAGGPVNLDDLQGLMPGK